MARPSLESCAQTVSEASALLEGVRIDLLDLAREASGLGGVSLMERLARGCEQLTTQVDDLGKSISNTTLG
jgi:hypothetical protein